MIHTERSVPKKLAWTLAVLWSLAFIPLTCDEETRKQELRRCEQEAMWREDQQAGHPPHHRRGQEPNEFLGCPPEWR
jgi:hypothetical protein